MSTSSRRDSFDFVDLCRDLAESRGDATAYTWLRDGEVEEAKLTFAELDLHARKIAARLDELGLRGERALLLYPPGLEFVAAFLGCLYAGVVAVPMNTPRNERTAGTALGIARHAEPAVWLTHSALAGARWMELEPLRDCPSIATDRLPLEAGERWLPGDARRGELAFLQYTSGSTGAPKGVEVSHANLIRNEEMIRAAFGNGDDTVFVGWLPLFHDMGLVGNVLQPLFLGVHSVLMAPTAFVQKPVRWLAAITRYRGTTAGAPNFGYELCAQRVRPEQVEALDLSSWRVAYNGSEPVRAATLERFVERFASAGFRRESFYPCYGMAEASLFVTGGDAGEPCTLLDVDAEALKEERVRVVAADDGARKTLVGCGRGWLGQRVLIVDPNTRCAVDEDRVGEIWLQGPNVARGYRGLAPDAEDPFAARLADGEGPFLRSGDLGFLHAGELFVAGRLKDVIIQKGANHHPHDLELAAADSHPALRAGRAAAFSVEAENEERVVLVLEVQRDAARTLEACDEAAAQLERELAGAVRAALAAHFGLHAWRVVLIQPGTLPMTSSGKVQRRETRALWSRAELADFTTPLAPRRDLIPAP